MQMIHPKNSTNAIIYVRQNKILYNMFYDYDSVKLIA